MKRFYFLLLSIFIVSSQAKAQCVSNLLSNPDFETPVQPNIGNNLTGLYTIDGGWTIAGGPFNIIKTDSSAYVGGPDNAKSGLQYIDVTSAAGTVYQNFTLTDAGTLVNFGGYFSSREESGAYTNWTAKIDLISLPSLTVVATSSTRNFTNADGGLPAQEVWHFISGSATLAAGNYRYVVNLGDFGNFDSAYVNANCIVPIQLHSFTGALVNNKINLNWKVATATNFSHFEIEKSSNGINFTTVGNVALQNTDQYQFADGLSINNSNYFYRLKLVDLDGNFTYSNILRFQSKTNTGLTILGNPVKNNLVVTGLQNSGHLAIYDIAGKMVQQKNVQSISELMEVNGLSKGLYILKYTNGQSTETQKFVKE